MNATVPGLPANIGALDEADLCAVFVLDSTGKVVAANRSARQLWAALDNSIVASPFAGLFALSSGSEPVEAQWKALSAATLDRWAPFTARPLEGPPREVRVRLERALGGAGTYIATIQLRLPEG